MKTRGPIKEFITLTAGVLAALVMVLTQVLFYQETAETPIDSSGEAPQELVVKLTNDALPTIGTVQLQPHFYLISDIILDTEVRTEIIETISEPLSAFLQVLFRRIISPNAP
jgi:cellobiose-specific phosphotransferase system component IIC